MIYPDVLLGVIFSYIDIVDETRIRQCLRMKHNWKRIERYYNIGEYLSYNDLDFLSDKQMTHVKCIFNLYYLLGHCAYCFNRPRLSNQEYCKSCLYDPKRFFSRKLCTLYHNSCSICLGRPYATSVYYSVGTYDSVYVKEQLLNFPQDPVIQFTPIMREGVIGREPDDAIWITDTYIHLIYESSDDKYMKPVMTLRKKKCCKYLQKILKLLP